MKMKTLSLLVLALMMSACAKHSDSDAPSYKSLSYAQFVNLGYCENLTDLYTCQQLYSQYQASGK